jgi:hypothetical protein
MTLRDKIRKSARYFYLCLLALFVVLSVAIVLLSPHLPPIFRPLSLILFLVPMFFIDRFVQCPACRSGLGTFVAHFGPLSSWAKPINYCPRCGIDLDSQIGP